MSDPASSTPNGYLVYVRSWTGHVWPQWWAELYFGERGDRRASVVAIVPLTADDGGLSLDELAKRYPLAAGSQILPDTADGRSEV